MLKNYIPSMIFLRTAWMDYYQGNDSETMIGDFSFLDKHPNAGHEKFNFRSFNGTMYGYAPVKDDAVNFKRINKNYETSDKYKTINECNTLNDITVIFFSHEPDPQGKAYIVGWYEHATIFEYFQNHKVNGETYYYICKTNKENAHIIPVAKRSKVIPYSKDSELGFGYGQSAKFYADQDNGKFRRDILKYIEKFKELYILDSNAEAIQQARDVEIRKLVEQHAIKIVIEYYESQGYKVQSVEKEKCGWDLTVTKKHEILYLEVKGTSLDNSNILLTYNEYSNLKKFYDIYKVCVVTNALSKNSKLNIFTIKKENNIFYGEDINNNRLNFTEQTRAICSIN